MTAAEREDASAGQQLLYSIPEACGAIYSEYVRLMGLITDALEVRLDEPSEEFDRRMVAGAIVDVLIASSDGSPVPERPIERGLTSSRSVCRCASSNSGDRSQAPVY